MKLFATTVRISSILPPPTHSYFPFGLYKRCVFYWIVRTKIRPNVVIPCVCVCDILASWGGLECWRKKYSHSCILRNVTHSSLSRWIALLCFFTCAIMNSSSYMASIWSGSARTTIRDLKWRLSDFCIYVVHICYMGGGEGIRYSVWTRHSHISTQHVCIKSCDWRRRGVCFAKLSLKRDRCLYCE